MGARRQGRGRVGVAPVHHVAVTQGLGTDASTSVACWVDTHGEEGEEAGWSWFGVGEEGEAH